MRDSCKDHGQSRASEMMFDLRAEKAQDCAAPSFLDQKLQWHGSFSNCICSTVCETSLKITGNVVHGESEIVFHMRAEKAQ